MKDIFETKKLLLNLQKKLFTAAFFITARKVSKFNGEPIYFVHDRYTIEDLGEKNGKKWVRLSNSNACTPFHCLVLGVSTNIECSTWWKRSRFMKSFGVIDKKEHKSEWTWNPDTENPISLFVIKGNTDEEVSEAMDKGAWQSILNYNSTSDSWWIDCPDYMDRFGIYGYLISLLEVFKNWKTIERD